MSFKEALTLSSLSLSSEDWDRSEGEIDPSHSLIGGRTSQSGSTPRNSVAFPSSDGGGVAALVEETPRRRRSHTGRASTGPRRGKDGGGRSLSELMRLHAEKGTDVTFSAEEASRVADVLKQWINSGTSPYEGEDDFFSSRSQDDSSVRSKRLSRPSAARELTRGGGGGGGRPRGQSDTFARRSGPGLNSPANIDSSS